MVLTVTALLLLTRLLTLPKYVVVAAHRIDTALGGSHHVERGAAHTVFFLFHV